MPATQEQTDNEQTTFTHEDVQAMDLEDLTEATPEAVEAVQAIDRRIADLEGRLKAGEPGTEAIRDAKDNLQAARENLKATRTAYELGNATEEEVETAEDAVEAAEAELEERRREVEESSMPGHRREAIRNALDELREEREAAVESAKDAIRARAKAVRDEVAKGAYEKLAAGVEQFGRIRALRRHVNNAVGIERSGGFNNRTRDVLTNSRSVPSIGDPEDITVREVLKNGQEAFGADVEAALQQRQ